MTEYLDAGGEVEEEDPGGEEDAEQSQQDVSVQLFRDHLQHNTI